MTRTRRDNRQPPIAPPVVPIGRSITSAEYREREIRRMERALGYPTGFANSERRNKLVEDEYDCLVRHGLLDDA